MFDTAMIGKKIKQARIDRNMTQMNLADAMGVSYQAVSNWERGNSMPDISKLGDLCAVLHITVNDLLGIEAPVVEKAMAQEELTIEELAEVAPVMPPKMMQSSIQQMQSRLQAGLAKMSEKLEQTFGDGGTFESQMGKVMDAMESGQVTIHVREGKSGKRLDLYRIAEMAPFLDEESLNRLLLNANLTDLDGLEELAPFVSEETLVKLVERAQLDDLEPVVDIAPFLSKGALDRIVERCIESGNLDNIEELAPFLAKETLNRVVDAVVAGKLDVDDVDIVELYPFLSKETLQRLAKHMMENQNLDALEEMLHFMK